MNESRIFKNYPDVVEVDDVMNMLHIGKNKVYELLQKKIIKSIKVGKKYIIPKQSVIEFISI